MLEIMIKRVTTDGKNLKILTRVDLISSFFGKNNGNLVPRIINLSKFIFLYAIVVKNILFIIH